MASRAEKQRRKKARAGSAARGDAPMAQPKGAATVVDTARKPFEPRDDGLDFLRSKGRITARQFKVGRQYGIWFRAATIEGDASIKVVDPGATRGGGGDRPIGADLLNAEWIAECRSRLARARSALGHLAEWIAVVDLICGRGLRPREISTVQRETEQIETALRLALDVLIKHVAEEAGAQADRSARIELWFAPEVAEEDRAPA